LLLAGFHFGVVPGFVFYKRRLIGGRKVVAAFTGFEANLEEIKKYCALIRKV